MNHRLKKLRVKLKENKLDALLVSNAINRCYVSGFTGSAGFLLISQKSAMLATDFRYIEQAEKQAPDFEVVRIAGEFAGWFPDLVTKLRAKRIGFESDALTLTDYRHLVKAARKLPPKSRPTLVSMQGMIESLRAIKYPGEIELIEKAAVLADAAVEHAQVILKPGITEKKLAWELEKFLKENGSESLPFEIIAASGPNSALPHAQPSDRVIEKGEPVVIDLGARVDSYTSDMTRTVCFGEPAEDFKRIYRIVHRAQDVAIKGIRPGITGGDADLLARQVIAKANYGNEFGHSLGHGVGIETHEEPRLGQKSKDVLAAGMVFTVEPGIYLPGWGGVRIEDMILLETGKARILTKAGKMGF